MDDWVHQAADDWHKCPLKADVRALLEYLEMMTLSPAAARRADIAALQQAGLSDRAIHDAVQIAAYFNYINRVADGLGIDPEPGLRTWGRTSSCQRDSS